MPAFTDGYTLDTAGTRAFFKLFELTLRNHSQQLLDTIKRSNPLLEKIAGSGGFKAKEGAIGLRNVDTILARPNENMHFARMTEEIDTKSNSYTEKLEWDWKFAYSGFTVNDNILQVNESKPLFKIMDIEKRALEEGMRRFMARQVYAHGDTSIEIGGLPYLLSFNPYATHWDSATSKYVPNTLEDETTPFELWVFNLKRSGTPGDDNEFWRNRICAFPRVNDATTINANSFTSNPLTSYTYEGENLYQRSCKMLINRMNQIVREIEANYSGLDLIICSQDLYDMYMYYIINMTHFEITKTYPKGIDVGIDSIKFLGIDMKFDFNCPKGTMYFLNTKNIEFKYLKGANFVPIIKEAPNKFEHSYITKFIGNMIINMPRSMAIIWTGEGYFGKLPRYVWQGIFTDDTLSAFDPNCKYNMANELKYFNPDYTPYKHTLTLAGVKLFPMGGDLSVYKDTAGTAKVLNVQNSGFSASGVWVDHPKDPVKEEEVKEQGKGGAGGGS
jgi:hypothetical protein